MRFPRDKLVILLLVSIALLLPVAGNAKPLQVFVSVLPIESEGKEPGPRALTALIGEAKRKGAKVIFIEPQFSRKLADQVARAIGGRVVAIDPLSPDYVDNLRKVARKIAETQ